MAAPVTYPSEASISTWKHLSPASHPVRWVECMNSLVFCLVSVRELTYLLMASMSTACEGEKEKAKGLCVCLWKMVMFSQRSMQRVSLLDEAKSLKLQMERLQNGRPFEHSSQNQVPSPRMKID